MRSLLTALMILILGLSPIPVQALESDSIWQEWLSIPSIKCLLPQIASCINKPNPVVTQYHWSAAQTFNHLQSTMVFHKGMNFPSQLIEAAHWNLDLDVVNTKEIDIADPGYTQSCFSCHYYAIPIIDTNAILIERDLTARTTGGTARMITLYAAAVDLGNGHYLY